MHQFSHFGDGVGAFEDKDDGSSLGANDGRLDGPELGIDVVVSTEGIALGIADGSLVGDAKGTKFGIADGLLAGIAEGIELGIADGSLIGDLEGITLGIAKGPLVGIEEGCWQSQPLQSHKNASSIPFPVISHTSSVEPYLSSQ